MIAPAGTRARSAGRLPRWLPGCLLCLCACRPATAPPPPAGPSAVERGREIYLHGVTLSGRPILADVNGSAVPASSFPCAGCHGRDGRGRAEGGVTPPNLRWSSLARPYDVTTPTGRHHPPYDERLAIRAIAMGMDAAGNRLDAVMPRFQLLRGDAEDLLAYLKALGSEPDAGITSTQLRIGLVLPSEGPGVAAARAAQATVAAYFEAVNHRGGLYGRTLELQALEAPSDPAARRAVLEKFFDDKQPLALTATVLEGDDGILPAVVNERAVPVVCALSLFPRRHDPPERYLFYLHSGVAEQGEALVGYAAKRRPGAGVAIVYPARSAIVAEAALRVAGRCRSLGLGEPAMVEADAGTPLDGKWGDATNLGLIVVLGAPALEPILDEVSKLRAKPLVLVAGAQVRELLAAPAGLNGRLFASLAFLPPEGPAGALPEEEAPARSDGPAVGKPGVRSTPPYAAAQFAALASATVLVEALERAGRDVDRDRLVEVLESMRGIRASSLPPLSFGRNRRIGLLGASIIGVDPAHKSIAATGEFVEAE